MAEILHKPLQVIATSTSTTILIKEIIKPEGVIPKAYAEFEVNI